ncbi:hypothetical protein KY321_02950 [Candidatus Woesearchaeota archaeon]|nr:hypothetical protein [Candidatus Woesearchaeota archaeon]
MRCTLILLVLLLLVGCAQKSVELNNDNNLTQEVKSQDLEKEELNSISNTVKICNELCKTDKEAYCLEERKFVLNEKEIKGTCRSFAKKGTLYQDFNRCPTFCKEYGNI